MRAALSVSIVALFSWTLALVHVRGEPIDKPEFPSPESILRKVAGRARAQRIAARPSGYVCTRQTLTEDFDKEGRLTERQVKVGETHSRPGGAAEAEKWTSQNGINLEEELLFRYHFTVTQRETLDGRPTLVLTFVPKNPPAPIRHLQDRILNHVIGVIWVDEQEHELVRADVSLGEPVSFGILGAIEFFSFGFERARDDHGNWLTRWTDTMVNARKFLKPIQTRKRVEWSDFKKLAAQ
jgi:hypothetical protein